jgi:RecB family exonuclease
MAEAGSGPPLLVTLADGRTVALRGRIDRVDRAPDGSRLVVLDYKTGASSPYSVLTKDPVKRGQLLQLPIYALAAQSVHGPAPVEAHYWFATEEQGYERKGYPVEETVLEALHGALGIILNGIASGLFPARPGKPRNESYDNCSFCPYDRVCPRDRSRLWEHKRAAPELRRYVEMAEPDE